MTSLFSPQAQAQSVKWTTGHRGGQAASGCYLFWSCTYSSSFDVNATSPAGEKLPPPPPTQQQLATPTAARASPFLMRSNPTKFRETEPNGTQIRGRGTKNNFGKTHFKGKLKIALQVLQINTHSWVFFLCSNERMCTLLWTHPQLHHDLFVTRVGRAQPLRPLTHPKQGKFWSRLFPIPYRRTQKESCGPRCAPVAPFIDCATVVCVTKCKIKEKKIKRRLNKTAWQLQQSHNQQSQKKKNCYTFFVCLFSFYYMDIMDNKGFWFIINFINYIFWYESRI